MQYSTSFARLLSLCMVLPAALALVPDWTPPLSTSGRYVVDARGQRFKLKSANWHGASGTWNGSGDKNDDSTSHSGENSHVLPQGLQYVPLDEMLDSFEQLGINSIRLPFSNEMLHDNSTIPDAWVAANPQLRGKTPLEVYDAVIKALTNRRFAVILNNHTNKSRWCCGVNDGNERWNKSQSEEQWIQDWIAIVKRYRDNKRVVGADLYNEVRRDILDDPNWGVYDSHDWYLAAHHAGDRILTEANPDVLIIIEGINWAGIPSDLTPHSRPTLIHANELSHTLVQPNKLVYSAHFYGYTGPNHSGATGIGETTDPRYQDLSKSDLYKAYIDSATFVALSKDKHYNAPLWMSEFGVHGIGGVSDVTRAWWDNTLAFLIANDIDFAYWPLVGFRDAGGLWGLINWDRTTTPAKRDGLLDGHDWRKDSFLALTNSSSGLTGAPPQVDRWRMLNVDAENYVKSAKMLARGDWDVGARKAACPDGLRLIGLSAGSPARGLCTDAALGAAMWDTAETVNDNRNVRSDWAKSFTKFQCRDDWFAIGYAVRGNKVSSVLCAKSNKVLEKGSSRTVWFDQGDNRGDGLGGEFAYKQYKGQCNRDEYIAGIAFTTAWLQPGVPAAILCRK